MARDAVTASASPLATMAIGGAAASCPRPARWGNGRTHQGARALIRPALPGSARVIALPGTSGARDSRRKRVASSASGQKRASRATWAPGFIARAVIACRTARLGTCSARETSRRFATRSGDGRITVPSAIRVSVAIQPPQHARPPPPWSVGWKNTAVTGPVVVESLDFSANYSFL